VGSHSHLTLISRASRSHPTLLSLSTCDSSKVVQDFVHQPNYWTSGNQCIVNGYIVISNFIEHLDLAIFENHSQRHSFGRFRLRGRDGDHGACLPVSLHPISCKSDGYGPTCEVLLVCIFVLKTNHLRSTHKICHTHLLLTDVQQKSVQRRSENLDCNHRKLLLCCIVLLVYLITCRSSACL
jgi:hypothetical protein